MDDLDRSAEFTPAQLDLLEDALSDPELLPEGASPEVVARLESFREILGLTEEALPLIDVPPGLLDSVLEEARRSPAVVVGAAAEAPGLWQRLRSSLLLPGFALAATAALLMIVLRPDGAPLEDMSDGPGLFEGAAAKGESPVENADSRAQEAPAPPSPGAAAPAEMKAGAADATADKEAAMIFEEESMPAESADGAARQALARDSGAKKKDAKKPAVQSKSAPSKSAGDDDSSPKLADMDADFEDDVDPEDKDALRTLLQQADSDRQRGRCSSAEAAYSKLLGAKGNEEGRALMGLGLCAEARGDVSAAEGFYGRAKAINPALDSLISAERTKLSASKRDAKKVPTQKKASKSKSKSKSVPFD